MREFAKGFYSSKAWHECRESFIAERRAIDGGLCQQCHDALGYIVHHKKELTPGNIGDPDVTLNHRNLEFVCKQCHDKIHDYCGREIPRDRRVVFDASGNPMLDR